jgi:hypothetical protein
VGKVRITGITGVKTGKAKILLKRFGPEDLELQKDSARVLRQIAEGIDAGEIAVMRISKSRGPKRGEHTGKRSLHLVFYDNEEA